MYHSYVNNEGKWSVIIIKHKIITINVANKGGLHTLPPLKEESDDNKHQLCQQQLKIIA